MALRIRRYNSLNWVVERFQEGGTRLPSGKVTRKKWIITGYHPSLARACMDALTELIPIGTAGADIVPAIHAAKEAILAALQAATCPAAGLGSATGRDRPKKVSEVKKIEISSKRPSPEALKGKPPQKA